MYAITFFTLLEESLKLDGYEYQIQAQIVALPNMKKGDQRKVLQTFRDMANPRNKQADIKSDRMKLRKLLLGKRK